MVRAKFYSTQKECGEIVCKEISHWADGWYCYQVEKIEGAVDIIDIRHNIGGISFIVNPKDLLLVREA